MNKNLLAVLASFAMASAWSADTPAPKPTQPTTDQMIDQFRSDLQAKSADVMAKGLTLTADQAAKFWPMFEQFQKEQGALVDAQLKATQKYAASFQTLGDADAVAFINALLDRDLKMQQLRVAWLKKFQGVVPTKIAARAIQIDRRLGNVAQVGISSQVPLIQ
jgi:Spy/CpxP family protein refolding chaperone